MLNLTPLYLKCVARGPCRDPHPEAAVWPQVAFRVELPYRGAKTPDLPPFAEAAMRTVACFVLLLAACASPSSEVVDVTPAAPASVMASGGSVDINIPTERAIVSEVVDASPADAWAALPKAWADLGIEVRESSRATRTLGNSRLVVMRRLGSTPLSRYLSCGAGIQGPFADMYRIQMSIQSAVVPAQGGGVEIRTYLEAVARNPEGTSNVQVPCTSTQRLEREIAARVRAHVQGG